MKGVFIGLGSNLDDPISQVTSAVSALEDIDDVTVIAKCSFYSSSPMGPQDQPDYINAVVEIETTLFAHDLLDELQKIEQQQGRERKEHWGARTIDLDLLIYGMNQLNDERLTVPHVGLHLREFVLYPLAEIAPTLDIPTLSSMKQLVEHCPLNGLQRLDEIWK